MATLANQLSSEELLKDLKSWYRDQPENLMFKNSDFLKLITKMRVEGKEQRFPSVVGRGGAVSGNFLVAVEAAANTVQLAEWKITPGRLFDVFSMNTADLTASKSNRGAYMRIMGLKMFCATEAFRKTMGAALYGSGFGELCYVKRTSAVGAGVSFTANIPQYAVIKLSEGSMVVFKKKIWDADDGTSTAYYKVSAIGSSKKNGFTSVTFTPNGNTSLAAGTYVMCLRGSTVASPATPSAGGRLPAGLASWFPYANGRKGIDVAGTDAYTAVSDSFYGVVRKSDIDGFCGSFYEGVVEGSAAATAYSGVKAQKRYQIILEVIRMCRNRGAESDVILMNDIDYAALQDEVAPYQIIDAQSSNGKLQQHFGGESQTYSFRTSWIDKVIPDPFCPQGLFYVLDSKTFEFWSYTGDNLIQDGVASEATGKPDPMSDNGSTVADNNYKLLIDDYLTVEPGEKTADGPTVLVTMQCMGTFVCVNPSVNGVGVFKTWVNSKSGATNTPELAPIGYNFLGNEGAAGETADNEYTA